MYTLYQIVKDVNIKQTLHQGHVKASSKLELIWGLFFGAWNFHDFHCEANFRIIKDLV